MSKAQVEAKRAAGLVAMIESGNCGAGFGFYLLDAPIPEAKPALAPEATKFDAMKDALRASVKVMNAPQLFPTPPHIAWRVVEFADIQPGMTVLEPSAGTGVLLDAIGTLAGVTAVEINHSLAESLRLRYPLHDVRCADFLVLGDELGQFDRIVMNPPFDHGSDIDHIKHAYGMLAPGG